MSEIFWVGLILMIAMFVVGFIGGIQSEKERREKVQRERS